MSTRPLSVALFILCAFSCGCGKVEAPGDNYFRGIRSGRLQSIPFSHDLQLLGFEGWRWVGRLPAALAREDGVRYRCWVEQERPLEEAETDSPPLAEVDGILSIHPRHRRRLDIDVLIQRQWSDGAPVYRQQTFINRRVNTGQLPLPEGHRFELELEASDGVLTLKPGVPICIGSATLRSWTRSSGPNTTFALHTALFRWYLQLDPIEE